MLISDMRPPGQDWLVRRVTDLERQVRELLAGRRLEAATIGAGGITVDSGGSIRVLDTAGGSVELSASGLLVRDASGVLVQQMGRLADGTYATQTLDNTGKEVLRAGQLAGGGAGLRAVDAAGHGVDLAQLAFGQAAALIPNPETTGSAGWNDLTTVGPTISNVLIGSSGRVKIILSAHITLATNANLGVSTAMGYMGVDVSGATTRPPIASEAFRLLIGYSGATLATPALNADASPSKVIYIEGLTPGLHTFEAKYGFLGDAGLTAQFSDRLVLVEPF